MGETPTGETTTYTVKRAVRFSGIGEHTLREAIADGSLPAIRIGRRLLLRRETLEAWLEELEQRGER